MTWVIGVLHAVGAVEAVEAAPKAKVIISEERMSGVEGEQKRRNQRAGSSSSEKEALK